MGMNIGVMRALNQLLQRASLANHFGHRFGGARDYYQVFGYQKNLTYNDMLAKYARQGIASRVVDAPAQALWDNPPIVFANNEEWNQAWNRIVTKHALWETVLRVDKLAGLGRYSCLFVGASDSIKPDRPARTRRDSQPLREVLYLQAYSQESAQINTVSTDPTSSQYMLPELYTIYPFKQGEQSLMPGFTAAMPSFKVHHSRILHVTENNLENKVFGSPRLERVFNDLDDMLKVSGGTAETYWLTANRGMQIDVDKEMELSPEDAADLSDELEEYMHQLRRFIRTRGVTITNLGSEVPNPEATFNMLVSLVSGATGIPRRILIGAEAGQLASEQDRANWAERVKARRVDFGEPMVIYPLINLLTNVGVLPSAEDLEITVEWPDAYQLSPLELAQKSAQHARSATNFAAAIDKLVKLKQGTPGTEAQVDPEGNPIPGSEKPGVEGEDFTDIISIDWVKEMLGQKPTKPQFDDPGDFSTSTD